MQTKIQVLYLAGITLQAGNIAMKQAQETGKRFVSKACRFPNTTLLV